MTDDFTVELCDEGQVLSHEWDRMGLSPAQKQLAMEQRMRTNE
ncbi:hypothetical protein [Knoellia subterranea]|uniref:Uncharacterized protein n=1 Tax=Knoellia subterranea KCTC 19937 TaxID=1385521 RepID=A0A0A0JHY8_9MICO|nr:hypothetical protein [Knoellia subterranea]KGN35281.1 hypothetical protein N803_09205 [Knoellia subterranea KCTC 19937]